MVVKAVYSQGRPLREGSIAPDFEDPRYEHRPIPPIPVPLWSEAASKLGKRLANEDDNRYTELDDFPRSKRQRVDDLADDLADSDNDANIAQTIEQDVPMETAETTLLVSPVLIQDSQSSPQDESAQLVRQPPHNSASLKHSSARTESELREISLISADLPFTKSHKHLLYDPDHGKTQALLTPPSDTFKKTSTSDANRSIAHASKRKFSPLQASTSGLRRPSVLQKVIYEIEDVDDSQMSPSSKVAKIEKSRKQRSTSKSSHTRNANSSPRRFQGSVLMKEISSVMNHDGSVLPMSPTRPRKDISRLAPDHEFKGDDDGYSQQFDALNARNATVPDTDVPYEEAFNQQGKEQMADSFITSTASKDNGQPNSDLNSKLGDVDMEDDLTELFTMQSDLEHQDEVKTSSGMPIKTAPSGGKDRVISDHKTAVDTQRIQNLAERKQRRKKKSNVSGTDILSSIVVDTSRPGDTQRSTPLDSPGEQLLEMQASSQKSRQDSMAKVTKKAERQARIQHEIQAKTGSTPKMSATEKKKKKRKASKGLDKASPFQALTKTTTQSSQEPANSITAPKSPYARESPPKGSIGLGFTNSPHRPSTVSVENASLSQRKLFEEKPASKESVQSDALKDNDISSEDDDETSGSTVATPSKQARPKDTQTSYQKVIAKAKPTCQKSDIAGLDTSRSFSVPLPAGMTLERYEALKKSHEENIASGKEVPKPRKIKTAPSAGKKVNTEEKEDPSPLAKTVGKESTSSANVPEKPKPNKRGAMKQPSEENKKEATSDTLAIAEQLKQKEPPKKAAKTTRTPSSTAVEARNPSQSSSAKPAQPAAARPAKGIPCLDSKQDVAKARSGVRDLKDRLAANRAKSSPARPTFAATAPQNAKKLDFEDDGSDEDSASDEDLEQKTEKLLATAKPDTSTRTAQPDSDSNDDEDDNED